MANDDADRPLGFLVMRSESGERPFPIIDRLFIGRECAGIEPSRRLLFDHLEISRNHCEIRLDVDHDRAYLVDTSTNGTRVNGDRVERAVPALIRPGDEIAVGSLTFEFQSGRFTAADQQDIRRTRTPITVAPMVLVVGDVINYSTISQITDTDVVAESVQALWGELGGVLADHRGTLNSYAGDALYAVWEPARLPNATELAVDFALAADLRVERVSPQLPLRSPDGSPIRMGWAVVRGDVAVTSMSRSAAVIGDATNLAFRLSGIAGRGGRARVMATRVIHDEVGGRFVWGEPEQVETKGRSGEETIYPVHARA